MIRAKLYKRKNNKYDFGSRFIKHYLIPNYDNMKIGDPHKTYRLYCEVNKESPLYNNMSYKLVYSGELGEVFNKLIEYNNFFRKMEKIESNNKINKTK